ncbi:hypothetical protein DFS33DRAFT_1347466, partial [Desarmillaria ectypa]
MLRAQRRAFRPIGCFRRNHVGLNMLGSLLIHVSSSLFLTDSGTREDVKTLHGYPVELSVVTLDKSVAFCSYVLQKSYCTGSHANAPELILVHISSDHQCNKHI